MVVDRKMATSVRRNKIKIRQTTNEKDWFPSTVVGYHLLYLVNIDCRWFPFSTDGADETKCEKGDRSEEDRRDDECLRCHASQSRRSKAKWMALQTPQSEKVARELPMASIKVCVD